MKVAIVDYGRGNLFSVARAVAELGAVPELVATPARLMGFSHVILPGVGAFADAMERLRSNGMDDALRLLPANGTKLLGICLGMQVLFECGTEGGGTAGLGLIRGQVRLIAAPGLRVPHVGWNSVRFAPGSPLGRGLQDGEHFYFVHSYAAFPVDPSLWQGTAWHGEPFAAAVGRDNVWGTQFHPEKSGAAGLALLGNFLQMPGGAKDVD